MIDLYLNVQAKYAQIKPEWKDEWFATVNLKESLSVAIDLYDNYERIHPCVIFPSVHGNTGRHTVSIQLFWSRFWLCMDLWLTDGGEGGLSYKKDGGAYQNFEKKP